MLFGDDSAWSNDAATLSFYLRADVIDKSAGHDGSAHFDDSIASTIFDLMSEFDNESSRTKDGLKWRFVVLQILPMIKKAMMLVRHEVLSMMLQHAFVMVEKMVAVV